MLKKMNVGKKINFGFGIVILMVALLLLSTILTSIQRSNDLNRVNTLSDMQTQANLMQEKFNDARYNTTVAFTALDAESAYNQIYSSMSESMGHLDNIEALAHEANISDYDEGISRTRSTMNMFTEGIRSIQANDAIMAADITTMTESSRQLAETAGSLYDIVTDLTISLADDTAVTVNRIRSIIRPVQDLNEKIDAMRIDSSYLLVGLDAAAAEGLYTHIETIRADAVAVRSLLTTDEGRRAVDSMLEALDTYEASLDAFSAIIGDSDRKLSETENHMVSVNDIVKQNVDGLATQVDALIETTMANSNITLIVMLAISILAVILSAVLSRIIGASITRPLGMMKEALVQAGSTGDLAFPPDVRERVRVESEAKDEIGESITAFVQMMDRMIEVGEILTAVADGDLTQDVKLLSEKDTMGTALKRMNENLNGMFSEINNVSSQVAVSSGEIATGAQGLAQGASEQAATVEEISAAITQISSQSETSVRTAKEASEAGAAIQSIALEGNEKMKSMMEAVQEISDASQSIERVIKAIDDIAFQTNILALNAAVEAARAGQHGKGFAVVADEVRNLAAKSAEAARETATLISANIEKTQLGISISGETAQALEKIVGGIQQTSESLLTITQQSESVRVATVQVNEAVGQVAQVVQQNSATSEESAAASEEMSSQAQVLKQLVARFRLKGSQDAGGLSAAAPDDYYGDETRFSVNF